MPTYEYRCPDGHAFDRFYRKISDAVSEVPCPECGKPAVRQLSGGAGLLFKGSGFYLTDYGKNAHRKPGPDASNAGKGSSGDSSGGGSSESSASSSGATEAKSSDAKSASAKETKASSTGTGGSGGESSTKKPSGGGSPKSDK